MPKLYGIVEEIMNSQDLTIKSVPWAKAPFISRLGFKKGEVPPHLEQFIPAKGTCKGVTGFVTYRGRRVPKAIVCLGEYVATKAGKRKRAE